MTDSIITYSLRKTGQEVLFNFHSNQFTYHWLTANEPHHPTPQPTQLRQIITW